jgi:uncharacterized protein
MNPEDLQKLVTLRMPFGKHQGTVLADLPGNYLNWFAREGFPQGEIGRLLNLMHEIDHNGLANCLNLCVNCNAAKKKRASDLQSFACRSLDRPLSRDRQRARCRV